MLKARWHRWGVHHGTALGIGSGAPEMFSSGRHQPAFWDKFEPCLSWTNRQCIEYQGQCTLNTHLTIAPNPMGRAILRAEMVYHQKLPTAKSLLYWWQGVIKDFWFSIKTWSSLRQKDWDKKVSISCVYENGFKMMTSCSFRFFCCCCLDPKMGISGSLWYLGSSSGAVK